MLDKKKNESDKMDILSSYDFDVNFFSEHYDAGIPDNQSINDIIENMRGVGLISLNKNFNSVDYLINNQDVLLSNMHPLEHWVRYGQKENRTVRRKEEFYTEIKNTITLRQLSRNLVIPVGDWPRTALTIHLFYQEYVPWIVSLLQNCPTDVDIFVTSPESSILKSFRETMEVYGHKHRLVLAESKNRGRNFGPMLVEFGRELRHYDVIGHIHTKKSAYTGKFRYDWWLHLVSGILSGKQHIQAIRLLLTQPSNHFGIVCAEKIQELPFWAYHDLKNNSMLQHLSYLIGREIEHSYGFSDYPVGGMFWVSRNVIQPLLNRDWVYSDFPEEQGQIDGTLQHAIERMIGHLAADNSLKTLKWLPKVHLFSKDDKPWLKELHSSVTIAHSHASIDASDTVSFDIFDTLLYRNSADVDYARRMIDFNHPGYLKGRTSAEAKCRAQLGSREDVKIIDIAYAMVAEGFSLGQALDLMAQEFDVDLSIMRRRDSVCSLVTYARTLGKRIIYVSDMYLSTKAIEKIIDQLNIPKPDRLFVSSDVGMRKDRGDMWEYINTLGFGRLLHFGDNIVSDLQNSSDNGIKSLFIPSILDKSEALKIVRDRSQLKVLEKQLWPIIKSYGIYPFFD